MDDYGLLDCAIRNNLDSDPHSSANANADLELRC